MSETRYTADHEWIRLDQGVATVGITAHAASQLGDLVFIELPEADRMVGAGEACAVVESVKAASDIFAPLAGQIIAVNAAIVDDPTIVSTTPEAAGWFFQIRITDPGNFAALMDRAAYDKMTGIG